MATVPNWIAKAVIVDPQRSEVHPITEWRATKTQVIVRTAPTGPEHRFYLDSLTLVGGPKSFPETRVHLAAPDDPKITEIRARHAVNRARGDVAATVDRVRLWDGGMSIEEAAKAIHDIRCAAVCALAELAEFL